MGIFDRLRNRGGGAEPETRDSASDIMGVLASQRYGSSSSGSVPITQETALRHSAVWACLKLRANVISTLPVDVFRRVDGVQVEVNKPPLLVDPGGGFNLVEWMSATQFDIDRYGNAFGLILERDAFGLPRTIQLVPAGNVAATVRQFKVVEYTICGDSYKPEDVWHERGQVTSGNPMGLAPLNYAAWSAGAYLSAQKFGLDMFSANGVPTGILQNTELPLVDPAVNDEIAQQWYAMAQNRGVAVMGKGWVWQGTQAPEAGQAFLDLMRYQVGDVCRFFDVPADMIDAGSSGSNVTYANITQRNLQFLIHNLGPAIAKREAALTRVIPGPRYVKFNTDALLRMDPETRARVINAQVATRILAPDEARELDNRPPMTEEQMAQLERLLPAKLINPKMELTA